MKRIVFLLLVACGNSNVITTDGSSDAPTDVLTCGPLLPDAAVTTMHPPKPAMPGICNPQLAADYAACNVNQDTTKCAQFQSGQPGAPCAACIESQSSDPTWGVIVFDGTKGTPNIGGCVDDAMMQTASEPNSCGQLLYASYQCQSAACGACPAGLSFDASSFDQCDAIAVATVCASFDARVQADAGPCGALQASLSGTARACFPDSTITDPNQQEIDWLTRIIGFMCGP